MSQVSSVKAGEFKFNIKMTDIDLGLAKAIKQMKELHNKVVKIGVFEGSTVGQFGGGSIEGEKPTTLIAEYAAVHEYGGGNIPEKAWMRSTIDANRAKYQKMLEDGVKDVQDGKQNAAQVLNTVGLEVQRDLKLKLTEIHLIDTGALRNSISVKLTSNK